jgi:GNAT superfamily N-acetyltransferase
MFTIRLASATDTGTLLDLIRGLAEYERLSHLVTASEATLKDALFGTQPGAEALLGFEGEHAVGFAVYFHNFSTFLGKRGLWLEDLFVQPEHRHKGYGRALFLQVARIAHERGCGRYEWSALDWNEPAIRFYKSMGAVALDDWTIFRITEPLQRLASDPENVKR